MSTEIITEPFSIEIYGYSGTAVNHDYAGTGIRLMDRMWQSIRKNSIKNKGMNIWAYEPGDRMFVGVELEEIPDASVGLEKKTVSMSKYVRCKHIGPYQKIKESVRKMNEELKSKGLETCFPHLEIYGHWVSDETKLETDLLRCLK